MTTFCTILLALLLPVHHEFPTPKGLVNCGFEQDIYICRKD